ncbi:MAG: methyl-accepting chemotaxis protein [Gallionella sp.]|nr:methyl-accepting chemotaxis protein [Gallionella sp.]
MRTNLPVTQKEIAVGADINIVSSTDLKGVITHVNDDFIAISGYSKEELIGQPHNILRHPDMPAEAFADLWETVKVGHGWEGIVKNRSKNGDHYWVHAHVTPTREDGKIVGYTSVRRGVTASEKANAEKVYQAIRAGKKVDLHAGERSLLSNVPLRLRLLMLLVFPVLGLLYFSVNSMWEKTQSLNELRAMRVTTELAVKSSAVIHEAQKERGMSAGFLSSNGMKFAGELPQQRRQTDQRIVELRELIATLDQGSLQAGFRDKLASAQEGLKTLEASRASIASLQLAPKDSFGFYTGFIASWLDVISYTARISSNQELARSTSAYLMFLNEKEMAGRERATVNGAFAADKFDGDAYQRFIGLLANQKTYSELFRGYASKNELDAYQDEANMEAVAEVERLRQVAIGKAATGGFGVDPAHWFKNITQKIEGMKQVEDVLADELRNLADQLETKARRQWWMFLLLTAFALSAALFFSVWIIRVLLRELGGEPKYARQVAQAIAGGDLNYKIAAREGDSSSLIASMRSMQDTLVYMVREAQRVSDEALRVRSALDDATANVTIADPNGKIVYINRTAQRMFKDNEEAIRKVMPHFVADKVLGSNFDSYHKNPGHQQAMVKQLSGLYKATIKIGDRTFKLTAMPVNNEKGQRIGTAVEWQDATLELKVESEVRTIVEAAKNGDFTRRIELSGKEGFMRELSQNVNGLVETSDKGLQEVVRMLGALSRGDLTDRISNDYSGTFGQLKNDSNGTAENLSQIISQIKDATDTINTAAKEIAAGNNDLSQRTEEQASSLEETASSMEELTSTVKQNAENAKQANQLAIGASDIASKGGTVVNQVVTTMDSINESSRKIVDIISVIDGIAFQTNILALNAAVEAARAGEQGRGFAVVAGEVRNLAQRSAAAAKEIKTLIGDSVEKVEGGSKLVAQAGQTMEEIVTAIKRVTDIMSEITAASVEQSAGIEQVNLAITQMDEVTQQNAALVEEAAAAAESLEEQAQNLSVSVGTFKVDSHSGSTAVARTPQHAVPVRKAASPAKVGSGKAPATKPQGKPHGDDGEWEEF